MNNNGDKKLSLMGYPPDGVISGRGNAPTQHSDRDGLSALFTVAILIKALLIGLRIDTCTSDLAQPGAMRFDWICKLPFIDPT